MGMGRCHEKKLNGKRKRKRKKQRNEMAISKDNKKLILLLLKLKCNKIIFVGDLEHSNPLLSSKTKHENHKVKKSKIWGISRWSLNLPCFLASLHASFLIPQNPLHVILQPLLVPRSGTNVSRRCNASSNPMAWSTLTKPTQDPVSKHLGEKGTFTIRSSLTLSKLPWDTTTGIVWAAMKSN